MKRNTLLFFFTAFAVLFSSCNKETPAEDVTPAMQQAEGYGKLVLRIADSPASTRAADYLTAQTYEKQVNNVQILVFDETGMLGAYHDAGTAVSDISLSMIAGTKTVYAVVNAPDCSGVTSLTELEEMAVDLSDNSIVASEGFIHTGFATCTVTANQTASVTVPVYRLVSRVAVARIANKLPAAYGNLQVENVMLINCVGNQNLSCTAEPSLWYNKYGRKDGATSADMIIDGSTYPASCETLTFHSVSQSVAKDGELAPSVPYLMYAYPNDTVADYTEWQSTWTPAKTRLVIVASVKNKTYYYPVTLDAIERNKTYTADITITGLGTEDPNTIIGKEEITVVVTVEPWSFGASIVETL